MKIPETTANVGAYYGNDENGQWQPNGVIIDSGVGGGVVGSGDAGLHRPPVYPVHIPRGHIPAGYVMAGAYYPPAAYPPVPAASQDDFADYMWMENEEEFDKQVMQQLEEEALMEQCIEAMLEDEQRERHRPVANGHTPFQPTTSNGSVSSGLSLEETVSRSTLNPLAAEFVPTRARAPPAAPAPAPAQAQPQPQPQPPVAQTEETTKEEIVEPTPTEEVQVTTAEPTEPAEQQVAVETKQEIVEIQEPEAVSQEAKTPVDPPEVSAADVQPIQDPKERRPKDQKKDSKPKAKADPKQKKPAVAVAVRSDTKVQKKVVKDTKAVKSDARVEDRVEGEPAAVTSPVPDVPKPSALTEEVTPEVKPINYAAAAKAVKPKKPGTPPAPNPTERTPPPQPALKADKPKGDKPKPIDKTDKKSLNKDKNKEKPAKVCNDKKKITK